MTRIPIESQTITKFTDTMSSEDCKYITNFMINSTNNDVNPDQMPWFQNNTIYYNSIKDDNVKQIIKNYREKIAKTIEEVYKEKVYPHLTTIVLWKPGQKMGRHHDQGNPGEIGFEMRDYTSILYLNDNYKGGNTFIRNDDIADDRWRREPNANFNDYISIPEEGTSIIFYGGDINAHGVEKIEEGLRVAMTTWYSTDPQYMGE